MNLILTTEEKKAIKKLQHIGDDSVYKVAFSIALCDCGIKDCEHKKMLLVKMLREFKVE